MLTAIKKRPIEGREIKMRGIMRVAFLSFVAMFNILIVVLVPWEQKNNPAI